MCFVLYILFWTTLLVLVMGFNIGYGDRTWTVMGFEVLVMEFEVFFIFFCFIVREKLDNQIQVQGSCAILHELFEVFRRTWMLVLIFRRYVADMYEDWNGSESFLFKVVMILVMNLW